MPGSEQTGGTAIPVLSLDPVMVRQARQLAAAAGQPIVEMARSHTTVSVERAVLRLGGLDGADPGDGMPWVNHLVDAVAASRAAAASPPSGNRNFTLPVAASPASAARLG